MSEEMTGSEKRALVKLVKVIAIAAFMLMSFYFFFLQGAIMSCDNGGGMIIKEKFSCVDVKKQNFCVDDISRDKNMIRIDTKTFPDLNFTGGVQ